MKTKMLNCLVEVAKSIEQTRDSIDQMLQCVVNLLPSSFQYPDYTCAGVTFKDKEYTTPNFKTSKFHLVANIFIDGKKVGFFDVYFHENISNIDDGSFINEEEVFLETIAKNIGSALERIQLQQFLQARVKELECLFRITKLIEKHSTSIDKILQGVVVILAESMQYPEIARVRIIIDRDEYSTDNFSVSEWKQNTDIKVGKHKIGILEVYYLEAIPTIDEEPFLKEEQLLITAVAERIGRTIERIRAEHQLEIERAALKSKNVALHELVEMVQKEKDYVGVRIQTNVDKIIMPIIYAIESEVPHSQLGYVTLLKKNLTEIASPFTNNISKKFSSLSPVEIQICNLIKNGFMTKEIAKIRGISPATVNRHREHIRKKLGVSNQKINLTTYLNSFTT